MRVTDGVMLELPAAKTFGVKWRSEERNGVSQNDAARPERLPLKGQATITKPAFAGCLVCIC